MLSGPKIWFVVAAMLLLFAVVTMAESRPDGSRATTATANQSSQNLNLEEIVTRMEEARLRTKQTPAFQLTREYQMFHGDEHQPASQVKAEINVIPPRDREYKIIESKGSDRGEKVVRKILEHEAAAEKVNPSPTAIIPANYDFALQGREMFEGVNCYLIALKPKREDPSLINGRAWVDPNTFSIRKLEGKMAKSPSWWVKDVDVVVNFGEIGGIWMQTASHAVADVRVIGKYTVEGKALEVQTANAVASNAHAQRKVRYHNRAADLPADLLYGGSIR